MSSKRISIKKQLKNLERRWSYQIRSGDERGVDQTLIEIGNIVLPALIVLAQQFELALTERIKFKEIYLESSSQGIMKTIDNPELIQKPFRLGSSEEEDGMINFYIFKREFYILLEQENYGDNSNLEKKFFKHPARNLFALADR